MLMQALCCAAASDRAHLAEDALARILPMTIHFTAYHRHERACVADGRGPLICHFGKGIDKGPDPGNPLRARKTIYDTGAFFTTCHSKKLLRNKRTCHRTCVWRENCIPAPRS